MKITGLLAVSATALLTLSACGSGSSGSGSTASQAGGGAGGAGTPGLSVASTSLGKVLVDGQGMTLYVLSADGTDKSTCSAQCLQFWPAATPGGTQQVSAATGHTTTPDGTPIATVGGHPVYAFALDHKPGDVNGQGISEFGGTWYAASPTGQPVTGRASGSTSSGTPSSSGRYGY
jgi:predicted lipoprotein with Yx(FWY)xxD motif